MVLMWSKGCGYGTVLKRSCNHKVWGELDPDNRAGNYEIVTRDTKGNFKAEDLTSRIQRKANKRCKLNVLEKMEQSIRKKIHAEETKASQRVVESARMRFDDAN